MADEIRCTYCREFKSADNFEQQGDHVVMASLGGVWVDPQVCEQCNGTVNVRVDQRIALDPLVAFLRDGFAIRDRYGHPGPARFAVRVPEGGVVKVTIADGAPQYEAAMPPSAVEQLAIDVDDQAALEHLVMRALELDQTSPADPLAIVRAAQPLAARATDPQTWSRFMAKLGLACGRDAYGDEWLDSPQARVLSDVLLGDGSPRFGQRDYYPPVEPAWPFEPPTHQLWIDGANGMAVLMVALFGQVLGAVPLSDEIPPEGAETCWTLDPVARTFKRRQYDGVWGGTAAARLTKEGHNVVMVMSDPPMMFVEDGPNGPAAMPVPAIRADSPADAFQKVLGDQLEGPATS